MASTLRQVIRGLRQLLHQRHVVVATALESCGDLQAHLEYNRDLWKDRLKMILRSSVGDPSTADPIATPYSSFVHAQSVYQEEASSLPAARTTTTVLPFAQLPAEASPLNECARKRCEQAGIWRVLLLLFPADRPDYEGPPAEVSVGYHVCSEHRDAFLGEIDTIVNDAMWHAICTGFADTGQLPPDRERIEVRFDSNVVWN